MRSIDGIAAAFKPYLSMMWPLSPINQVPLKKIYIPETPIAICFIFMHYKETEVHKIEQTCTQWTDPHCPPRVWIPHSKMHVLGCAFFTDYIHKGFEATWSQKMFKHQVPH